MKQIDLASYQPERNGQRINLFLPSEESLSELAYKVLHNTVGSRLLCCYRSRDNDRLKLTYDVSRLVPLSALVHTLTPEQTLGVAGELLDGLTQIYDIGFLEYANTCLDLDSIFLDSNNHWVYLLHVPVKSGGDKMGRNEFEQNFRACMQLILESARAGDALGALKEALVSGLPLLPDLRSLLQDGVFADPEPQEQPPTPDTGEAEPTPGFWSRVFGRVRGGAVSPPPPPKTVWRLIGVNTSEPVDLILTGPNYIVGKKAQAVHGVITCNSSISRVHCQFLISGAQCSVMDLDSSNGTYLNGKRLKPKQIYEIAPDDRIRLSTSDFLLRREQE